MKILLASVSSSSSPDGVSRHAANAVRCLLSHRSVERVSLVIGSWQADSFHSLIDIVDDRLQVSTVDIGRSAWDRNRWYWSTLPGLNRQLGSDLVHLSHPVPVCRTAFASPVVATLHDLYPYDMPANFGYPRVLGNRLILRQCLRAIDRIACVSNTTKTRLEVHLPAVMSKAVTIYNSVVGRPVDRSPDSFTSACKKPFLLCVAQHRRNKNIPIAIEVFRRLLKAQELPREARLLIVGVRGPETGRLSRIILQDGLNGRVELRENISDAELHWCYANCELLLAPSSIEGFGLPVVEAMLHRCRIVCSDIPAFREVGGSYCDYVELGRDQISAFEQAARQTLRSYRLRTAQTDQFLPHHIGSAYLRLYKDLIYHAPIPSPHVRNSPTPLLGREHS